MKKIYLTFDIETIVSGISKDSNYLTGVYLASMFIAEEMRKRQLKGTFFISLSSKQNEIDQSIYLEFIKWLLHSLKSYENIKIEPHLHALNLPVSFETKYDEFNKYDLNKQKELLVYAKDFFQSQNIHVNSFRPGGFSVNEFYYDSLFESGYKNSSILQKEEKPTINLVTGEIEKNNVYQTKNGIKEYPVTSIKIRSIKGKEELVNLSPDFFKLSTVENYINKLDYININFHSFSIYQNRLIRETHDNQFYKSLKFILLESPLKRFLKLTSIQTLNTNTVFANELLCWLDYIEQNSFETYFIGD
ncbi:MAG: hypothetical protein C4K58_01550 [Flavobacteriaceae bacterium]|nr:MAG: hypothetical protein C4K58_01550 [Flavobacteriaceae bacterium]